jgi:hypothetical protein
MHVLLSVTVITVSFTSSARCCFFDGCSCPMNYNMLSYSSCGAEGIGEGEEI